MTSFHTNMKPTTQPEATSPHDTSTDHKADYALPIATTPKHGSDYRNDELTLRDIRKIINSGNDAQKLIGKICRYKSMTHGSREGIIIDYTPSSGILLETGKAEYFIFYLYSGCSAD